MIWSATARVLTPESYILFNPHAVLYHLSRCIHKFPPPHYAFAQIVGFTSGYYEIDANNRCLSVCNSLIHYNVGTQPHWVKKLQYNYTFALHSYCMGRQSRILANTLLFFWLVVKTLNQLFSFVVVHPRTAHVVAELLKAIIVFSDRATTVMWLACQLIS